MSIATTRIAGRYRNHASIRIHARPPGPGGVYFFECQGFVKIGMSIDIFGRLESLQRENPLVVNVLGVIVTQGGRAPKLECELHERFRSAHHRGEWFRLTEEIMAFIQEHATCVDTPRL
jgi:hypothetical protein